MLILKDGCENKLLRALYVGRFQPLHKGHIEALKHIMVKADELVIVVGSAQHSHSLDNPFTAGERIMMLREALDEVEITAKYYIIPVPDATMHSVWVSKVISYSPPFDIVYSNEPLTSRLFKEFGFKVGKIPFFHREIYSATEARRRILEEEDWMKLLPQSVIAVITEIEGIERLRDLAKKNKNF